MIDLTQTCIIAPGKPKKSGYHYCKINGKLWRAHRFSYIMTYGPPPPEKPFILHKCNNKACWNPGHLEAGTQSENMADMLKAGTHSGARKTHCKNGHKLGGDNLTNFELKFGKRRCRSCHNTRLRRRSK